MKATELFRDIEEDELGQLAACTRCLTRPRHSLILSAGSEERGLFVVERGTARLYRTAQNREITLAAFGPGDIFGLMFFSPAVGHESHFQATSDEVHLCYVPMVCLEDFLRGQPQIARRMLELNGRTIAQLADLVEELALYDVRSRLGHLLARLVRGRDSGYISQSHEELAALIAASQPEVTRTLATLTDCRFIQKERHRHGITVLDRDALANLGHEGC